MNKPTALPPGSRIGILGGGQLGRMLSLAASRLGMKTHIYCPDPESPAFEVTPHKTVAAYDDETALAAFAEAVDVVTYEFENVPDATARFLAARKPLAPGAEALAISQDRIREKTFLQSAGQQVAPWRPVNTSAEFEAALAEIGMPAVLKTARFGYDGKGQRTIRSAADAKAAFAALGGSASLVLEAFVPFEKEISVIVARNASGETVTYDPAENVHRDHILKLSTVPATVAPAIAAQAAEAARAIADRLDYVGVMGIEFFVAPDALLVNEIAPRVHNSGHWTEAVCTTDQFENHIRAIANWPLGATRRFADVEMENLIGDEADSLLDRLVAGSRPQLYGKTEARPGRKMGHVNRVNPWREP